MLLNNTINNNSHSNITLLSSLTITPWTHHFNDKLASKLLTKRFDQLACSPLPLHQDHRLNPLIQNIPITLLLSRFRLTKEQRLNSIENDRGWKRNNGTSNNNEDMVRGLRRMRVGRQTTRMSWKDPLWILLCCLCSIRYVGAPLASLREVERADEVVLQIHDRITNPAARASILKLRLAIRTAELEVPGLLNVLISEIVDSVEVR